MFLAKAMKWSCLTAKTASIGDISELSSRNRWNTENCYI